MPGPAASYNSSYLPAKLLWLAASFPEAFSRTGVRLFSKSDVRNSADPQENLAEKG
jgi:hypothetical protein